MRKQCAVCPEEFEAKRAAAKYCSPKCRKRASRQLDEPSEPVSDIAKDEAETQSDIGFVAESTVAELMAAGRQDTAIGRAAIAIAHRIDTATFDTGSAYAALVKQHADSLVKALDGAKAAADPLDELRERRERKHAG